MAKVKTAYFCQSCGTQSAKWVGKCTSCGEWNTYIEEVLQKEKKGEASSFGNGRINQPIPIDAIPLDQQERLVLQDGELNRVLGGGIVAGSLILFGGEPGIGKSTLSLQMALELKGKKVLYVTGEESEQQVKMRAERMGKKNEVCYILSETNTQNIFAQIQAIDPQIIIIDSIQTLHTAYIESSPGSISQIRECTAEFLKFAKTTGAPVLLIGHITKEGTLAGPKVMEHMVDTVLQFEGDRHHAYRILRTSKNRFGSTNELGIYEMSEQGLRQVENPSEILITRHDEPMSGIAVAASMEGMRPLLVEIQALVSSAAYGTPQRSSTGFDLRRLNMLLAVLEKRCGFKLGIKDVFLNITGGLRIDDPSIDLAVVAAILSSNEDISIHVNVCFAAEVGLSGEVRPVSRCMQRISEAEKLGYEKILVSSRNKGITKEKHAIEIVMCSNVEEVFRYLFG